MIVETVAGKSITVTGDVVKTLKEDYFAERPGARLTAPLGWVGGNQEFINFAHVVHVRFEEEKANE